MENLESLKMELKKEQTRDFIKGLDLILGLKQDITDSNLISEIIRKANSAGRQLSLETDKPGKTVTLKADDLRSVKIDEQKMELFRRYKEGLEAEGGVVISQNNEISQNLILRGREAEQKLLGDRNCLVQFEPSRP